MMSVKSVILYFLPARLFAYGMVIGRTGGARRKYRITDFTDITDVGRATGGGSLAWRRQ